MPSVAQSLRLDWVELSDDAFAQTFRQVETVRQLSSLWDTPVRQLNYYAYHAPDVVAYTAFNIPRRNGKLRKIEAPNPSLKRIQRLMHESLQKIYRPPREVHGFVPERSIVTNAASHLQKSYVLKLDLEDFFPSIERRRIIGRLRAQPYAIGSEIAKLIGHLATNEQERLPQGSPSSPVVANIMARPLDVYLAQMCRKLGCRYTRYADDIVISTRKDSFPVEIARYPNAFGTDEVVVADEIVDVIQEYGFKLNQSKCRLRSRKSRQMATGLILNGPKPTPTKRYIRNLRALVHNWERYGWEEAAKKMAEAENRSVVADEKGLRGHVVGKINYLMMVRGKEDPVARSMMEAVVAIPPGE